MLDCKELTKKSGKLKGQILSKSQKSAKFRKNLTKSENLPNFGATKTRPSFLTSGARESFNCLRPAFIKAPILWHFNPKYQIWIETNVLGYAIGGMLSQLAFGTRPDEAVTKANLSQWHPVAFFWEIWF